MNGKVKFGEVFTGSVDVHPLRFLAPGLNVVRNTHLLKHLKRAVKNTKSTRGLTRTSFLVENAIGNSMSAEFIGERESNRTSTHNKHIDTFVCGHNSGPFLYFHRANYLAECM
ncbi:hypothetical protein KDH_25090 [Dictyobacter sp. S3.2.2.5]|uniref:Uncharacterized protein n=1 Tax=Dictyobacter halimunensis TaxID=3026934 RepID=A0ABQ6FPR2_9CHLR|nr:hypothetical protein KDH_25090 [Dictyobacter sp. S3.2.2.5]